MGKIKAYILDMTLKALRLASVKRPKGIWFPKSQISSNYSQEPLMDQVFVISDWILKKKGIKN